MEVNKNKTHQEIMTYLKYFLNLKVSDEALYVNSLMHPSYINEKNFNFSNQRQEYLGDSIIDFLCAEYLYYKFPNELEGFLTKTRAILVSSKALYVLALKLKINEVIILGRGEELQNGREKQSNLADAFEALISAIYLDQGMDSVKIFFEEKIKPIYEEKFEYFQEINYDYKTHLQEKTQLDNQVLKYIVVKEEGKSHQKTFYVNVEIDGLVYGTGKARSKKEAEKAAAKIAYTKLVSTNSEE